MVYRQNPLASVPFASLEWGKALMERLNLNTAYAHLAATWQGAVLFHDTETCRFLWLDIHEGKCRDVAAWASTDDPATRDAPFVFRARTAVWRRVCEGTLHPTTALATRQLKVTGNMFQVMRYAQATVAMVKSAQEVPTSWT